MTVSENVEMAILLGRKQQLVEFLSDANQKLVEVEAQLAVHRAKLNDKD
jgi:hypothetical protein